LRLGGDLGGAGGVLLAAAGGVLLGDARFVLATLLGLTLLIGACSLHHPLAGAQFLSGKVQVGVAAAALGRRRGRTRRGRRLSRRLGRLIGRARRA
jgi:hypothetical protein